MKLKDCDCGGAPQVTYDIEDHLKFTVLCETCGNQTHTCKSVEEAVALWNKTNYCALTPYEMVSA